MIQTTLLFILGFLCASFLALLVAPIIWRRAVGLTRRRIEASVPLTLDEIQADKDRLRAEFAMTARRLEMSVQSYKEKVASQAIELDRNREEKRRLDEERDEMRGTVRELGARVAELQTEVKLREDELARSAAKLVEVEQQLSEKALELHRVNELYDEASIDASSRQIELVAQETKVEQLLEDISVLRNERREADRRIREITAEAKEAHDALGAERSKIATQEKRLARLTAAIAEGEETIERREKELARLREQMQEGAHRERKLVIDLDRSTEEKARLEQQVADLTGQISRLISGATAGDLAGAVSKLEADRERVEERLRALVRENNELKAERNASRGTQPREDAEKREDNALLRAQIRDLAAEVVVLTAALEGPNSPINEILEAKDGKSSGISLADRVRALRKAATGAAR